MRGRKKETDQFPNLGRYGNWSATRGRGRRSFVDYPLNLTIDGAGCTKECRMARQEKSTLTNEASEIKAKVRKLAGAGQQGEAQRAPGVKPDPDHGQQGEAQRARYAFRTMADAWAVPKFIPQRIRGILPAKGLSLIYGDPGSLKSMFALHCAVSVALGRDVLPGVPVRKGRVLVIDSDNGPDRLGMRLQALARGCDVLRPADLPDLAYGPMMHNGTPIAIDTPAGLEALRWAIDDAQAELVILDSYGGACGAADMNKPEMQRHLLNLRSVAEALGIVVWGIHHSNKTGGMMGTQHFLSTADIPLEIRRPDPTGDLIELSPKKIRDGGQPVQSATWWYDATPDVDEFGVAVWLLERCGFRADPAATATGSKSAGHFAERVALQIVSETPNGLSQRALVVSVHANVNTKGKAKIGERYIQDIMLPSMVRRDLLRTEDGRQRAKLYFLGPKAAEVMS